MLCTKREHGFKVLALEDEQGGAMVGSEGRFPKSLIEFQGRFASEGRVQRICSSAGGRKGLSAPAAAKAAPGC